MKITIGENTKEHMKTLGLAGYPFTDKELAKQYKALMMKFHPDKGGDPEIAKRINEACKALENIAIPENLESARIIKQTYDTEKKDLFKKLFWKECPECRGTGRNIKKVHKRSKHDQFISEACPKCKGVGALEINRPFNPVIPLAAILQ